MDFSESVIADEIGNMSNANSLMIAHSRNAKEEVGVKPSTISQKFSNSFISEESNLGFSMQGGRKRGGSKKRNNEASMISESSIQEELSISGFGGSKAL